MSNRVLKKSIRGLFQIENRKAWLSVFSEFHGLTNSMKFAAPSMARVQAVFQQPAKGSRKNNFPVCERPGAHSARIGFGGFILLIFLTIPFYSCGAGTGGDESLSPFLFQDSLRVWPNPAWLYEDAKFYFAWEDFDGDMELPVISLKHEAENGVISFIEPEKIQAEGSTGGSITFVRKISDGDEGLYTIVVTDEAGNESNEIEITLFVNPTPRENAVADDDTEE